MTTGGQNKDDNLNTLPQPVRIVRPLAAGAIVRPAGSPNAWMVTFTDLVALMLTFFVLLYSMSSLNEVKWQNLTGSLAESLDSLEESKVVAPKAHLDIRPVRSVPGTDLDYLANVLSERLNADAIFGDIRFSNQQERLVISLPEGLILDQETGEVGANAERAMFALGGVFRSISNSVEIVSYPIDERPAATSRESREAVWIAALRRSIHLARLLEDAGYAGTIRPKGVAWEPETSQGRDETAPDAPAAPDAEQSSRYRVDVVVLDTTGER